MLEREIIHRGLNKLGKIFNKDISGDDVQIIYEILNSKDWTEWEFETAVEACVIECKFFPRPAELLERWQKDPAKISDPEFVPFQRTESDDQEIEDLIESSITNQHLKDVCRRIVFRTPAATYEPRIYCQTCDDKGLIEVYHPHTCHKAKARKLDVPSIRTVTVSCHCDRGPITSESSSRKPMRLFDKAKMPRVTEIAPTLQLAEVTAFYDKSVANDFADWSPAPF